MMNLSLMKTFFSSVDEEWNSPTADQIASRWFEQPDSVKIMRASANLTALVTNQGRHYTLRFNTDTLRPVEDLQNEIRLLLVLRNFNLPVQTPIKSRDNNFVELITVGDLRYTAVLFEFIPGEIKHPDDLELADFNRWGGALGQLHCTLSTHHLTQSINHPQIQEQLKSCHPPTEHGSLEKAALLEWVSTLAVNTSTYGLIHYDFELDNLIWNEGQIHIIDFDDTAVSWYAADIVFALQEIWDNHPDPADPRLNHFLEGYRREKDPGELPPSHFRGFSRLERFLDYHRLLKAVDLEANPDHPLWLNNLIDKLNRRIQKIQSAFSDHPVSAPPPGSLSAPSP